MRQFVTYCLEFEDFWMLFTEGSFQNNYGLPIEMIGAAMEPLGMMNLSQPFEARHKIRMIFTHHFR